MAKENKYLDLNDGYDFGFTMHDETEIVSETPQYSSMADEVEDLKQRLQAVNKIFMPLLQNLSRDPNKPMIKWPNRKEVLDKQMTNLKRLTSI